MEVAWKTLKGMIKKFAPKTGKRAQSETAVAADANPTAAGGDEGGDEDEDEAAFITKMQTKLPGMLKPKDR